MTHAGGRTLLQPAHGVGCLGDPPSALEIGEPAGGICDRSAEMHCLATETGPRFGDCLAIVLHEGDRLGGLAGEIVAAALKRGGGALLEVGDPRERRFEPPAFRLVLRDRHGKRLLAACRCRSGVADLLIQDQKCTAVGDVLLSGGSGAARQRKKGLEHLRLRSFSRI